MDAHAVLVVGAGPTGLVCALMLAVNGQRRAVSAHRPPNNIDERVPRTWLPAPVDGGLGCAGRRGADPGEIRTPRRRHRDARHQAVGHHHVGPA
jgi:hypothetical protein